MDLDGRHEGGRVLLVTGGTGGIGAAVALAVARTGASVVVTGRDGARGRAVLEELRRAAPDGTHAFVPADLALLAGTAALADAVLDRAPRLDGVVLCAGVLSRVPEWTSEGLERTFVVNYLSRYLLLRRLLPALAAAPSGRVVLVANAGRYRDTLDLGDLQHRRRRPGLAVAGRTQFANDLLAVELAERVAGSGTEVTCVYPGVVDTDCFRNARGFSAAAVRVARGVQRTVARSPQDAARTPAHLAVDRGAVGVNGRFFGPGLRERKVPARVRRPERRRALWDASELLVAPYLDPAAPARAAIRG
jgi:NAD(P)-dependent dehydrogenase (short-subunit alcohol dehydrogenase family)